MLLTQSPEIGNHPTHRPVPKIVGIPVLGQNSDNFGVDEILADEQVSWDAQAGGGSGAYVTDRILWPATDIRGSVCDLVEFDDATDTATVVQHRTYDAFGRHLATYELSGGTLVAVTTPAVTHLIGFTGRPGEVTTGLQNNLHRWYDVSVGSWINEDPIGFEGGDANLYRYCGNDPVNGTDPNGNVPLAVVGAGIGGLFGAGAYCYQYLTGGVEEWSWWDFGAYTAGGAAAGGVAALTFGASLSLTAGLGTVGGMAGAGGLAGLAGGATGGLIIGAGTTIDDAWRGDASWGDVAIAGLVGAGRGAFYGGIAGSTAGAMFPIVASLTGGGVAGGFIAGSTSAMFGDASAQLAGMTVGLQDNYNFGQTAFAGTGGGLIGGYVGYRDPSLGGLAGRVVVKGGKWDYFFGRVTSNPHNQARSLQNLKDLKALGFDDTAAGRAALTKLFRFGRYLPETARHTTQYGITITRRVPVGNVGAIDVKYFYPGGDLSTTPEVSTIIPKVFR